MKLIIVVMPGAFLVASIFTWSAGESSGSLVLLVEAFIIGFIFWVVFPRRYEVYEDHIRIVLGGPFSVRVGFDRVKTIRVTSRLSLTVNLVTTISRSYVEIVKKKGLSIAITPRNGDSFVENANRVLSQWVKATGQVEPRGR